MDKKEQEMLDVIEDLIYQSCYVSKDNVLDSMAISTYADGIRLLGEYNRVKIITDHGRRVIAKTKEEVE